MTLLAYLFTIWTVIHVGLNALVPLGQGASLAALLTSFHEPSSVPCFIWALAFYVVVAKAGRSTSPALLMVASVLASVAVRSGYVTLDIHVCANMFGFLPFFLFGAWYSSAVIQSDLLRTRWYVAAAATLYVALLLVLHEQLAPPRLVRPATFLLAALGVNMGICASIVACRSERLARVPRCLGRNTLAVYVAHVPIVQLLSLALPLAGGALWLDQV